MLVGRVHSIALLALPDVHCRGEHARFGSVAEACTQFGVSPAEITIVCGDPATDRVRFPTGGARVVVVGDQAMIPRGMLLARDADELAGLLDLRVMVHRDGLAIPVLSLEYEAAAYEMIGRHEGAALLRAAGAATAGEAGDV